jgi:type IX secretion system PorP/SprF family membrane protein
VKFTPLILVCSVVFFVLTLKSQDLHFSQFNENPALLNPALTGGNGIRASINYKNQWRSVTTPFKTYAASFEMRSGAKKKKKENADFGLITTTEVPKAFFGAGISIFRDKAGDGNMGLTQVNLSLASFVPTGKKSYFSLGLQAGSVQRRLENSSFIFPNQFNGGAYDSNLESGENFRSETFRHFDFAGGVQWQYLDENRGIKYHKERRAQLGFSVYHINQAKQKYLVSITDVVLMKYVTHGNFLFTIPNSRTALAPSYLVQLQGPYTEITAGVLLKYYMKNDTKYTGYVKRNALGFGAYYRNADALIIASLLEWKEQYALGLSYDLNVSSLSKASRLRGGMEITLRYNVANAFLYQK